MGRTVLELEHPMNSFTPSFRLPACPACSTMAALERPYWRLASNVTRARGVNCYTAVACRHAAEVFTTGKLWDDPEIMQLVEESWAARVEKLFAEKTANWPVLQVDRFRRELGDKATLRGSTESLALTFPPDGPAQPNKQTKHG